MFFLQEFFSLPTFEKSTFGLFSTYLPADFRMMKRPFEAFQSILTISHCDDCFFFIFIN